MSTPLLKEQEKVVVLDFGSQFNQLITRRIREFGVFSELHPHTITAQEIKEMNDLFKSLIKEFETHNFTQ